MLKAAKAEAEAKQAATEQALNMLKADLVGRELLAAEEQQGQANQPLKASKKKSKKKKVVHLRTSYSCLQVWGPASLYLYLIFGSVCQSMPVVYETRHTSIV